MLISFEHQGRSLNADLIYDFNQVKDAVLVKHLFINKEIHEDILFYYNGKNLNSASILQTNFPSTYRNISNAIVENFRTMELFNEVRSQMFLS